MGRPRRAFALSATFALVIAGSGGAHAAEPINDGNGVAAKLALMSVQEKTDEEISVNLGLRRVKTATPELLPTVRASDPEFDMNTQAPRLYYNSADAYYYVVADWGWVSNAWKEDAGKFDYVNVGGFDVHAVKFSLRIVNLVSDKPSMAICRKKVNIDAGSNECYTVSSLRENNEYGTAVQFQDKAFWGAGQGRGYTNADRGSLVVPFRRDASGCLQIRAKYGHSYSSAQLTGVDIGKDSFGISWSSEGKAWAEASPVLRLGCKES